MVSDNYSESDNSSWKAMKKVLQTDRSENLPVKLQSISNEKPKFKGKRDLVSLYQLFDDKDYQSNLVQILQINDDMSDEVKLSYYLIIILLAD